MVFVVIFGVCVCVCDLHFFMCVLILKFGLLGGLSVRLFCTCEMVASGGGVDRSPPPPPQTHVRIHTHTHKHARAYKNISAQGFIVNKISSTATNTSQDVLQNNRQNS